MRRFLSPVRLEQVAIESIFVSRLASRSQSSRFFIDFVPFDFGRSWELLRFGPRHLETREVLSICFERAELRELPMFAKIEGPLIEFAAATPDEQTEIVKACRSCVRNNGLELLSKRERWRPGDLKIPFGCLLVLARGVLTADVFRRGVATTETLQKLLGAYPGSKLR